MTDQKMLIGSLSNDLYRVANLIQRGSETAAQKFWQESKRWSKELKNHTLKKYIRDIIYDLELNQNSTLSLSFAEKLLMYSVLLQNYALHMK
jgi:hypothetical protein